MIIAQQLNKSINLRKKNVRTKNVRTKNTISHHRSKILTQNTVYCTALGA